MTVNGENVLIAVSVWSLILGAMSGGFGYRLGQLDERDKWRKRFQQSVSASRRDEGSKS